MSQPSHLRVTLSLSVMFETNGEPASAISDRLAAMPRFLRDTGELAGPGPATELGYSWTVFSLPVTGREFNVWEEDAEYPRESWSCAAMAGETLLGYWDWVARQRESNE